AASAPASAKPAASSATSAPASTSAAASGQLKTTDDILAALKSVASGKTINLLDITASLPDDQVAKIKQTAGVDLKITQLPPTDAFQKLFLDLQTSAGGFDFASFQPYNMGAFAPYLVDLSDFNKKSGWDQSAVAKGFQWYGWYPNQQTGKQLALPKGGDLFILHYRTDALQQAGLSVPKTYDDLLKAAQKLNGLDVGGKKLAGFAPRTSRALTYTWWASFFGAWGGDWFTADWKPAVNSDAGVASLDYANQLVKAGPPNAANMGFADINNMWTQGDAAMTIHYPVSATIAQQTKGSATAGKIATAALPSGPAGSRPAAIGGQAFGISKASKNPEAAYLLMRYFLHPDTALTLLVQGVEPVLTSELSDPKFVAALGDGKTTAQAELDEMSGKILSIPTIPEWNSLSETLDLHLSNVWLGQEAPKAALDAVAADWTQKLAAAGYTKPGTPPYAVQA
ncbi:MAG: extracellular solute-binding protein, partial [Chloroflexi bacterium]|nr:extracellular solute-binding protein [Chloroflexota bacterium]